MIHDSKKFLFLATVCLAIFGARAWAQTPARDQEFPGAEWVHTTPAAAGWNTSHMRRVEDDARALGFTATMLIQHGQVVAQIGDVEARTALHSCRKSFLSALIGLAVARGQIHLDDTLAQLDIDDVEPALTPAEKQATVRDLLEARSGIYHGAAYETRGMAEQRPERGSHAPGSFWYYNNWDFNALGGIYTQATQRSIYEALATEIATPIGMQDYRAQDGHDVREASSRYPAYTLRMSARDFARFALLYLHGGQWRGTQVVPAAWVAESTRPYSDTDSGGYGYLWWTGDALTPGHRARYPFPPDSFWLEGHLGQYAVVVPSLDLIVVTRVDGERTRRKVSKAQVAQFVLDVVEAAAPKGADSN